MSKKSNTAPASDDAPTSPLPLTPGDPKASRWITDQAWISGVSGLLSVVAVGAWFSATNTLSTGVHVLGAQLTSERHHSLLFALAVITVTMVAVEMVRLWRWDKTHFIQVAPDIKTGNYLRFFLNSLSNYLLYVLLIAFTIWLYETINEYGFRNNSAYYQPWFKFLDLLWVIYLWAGLPYGLLTRALKYNPDADRRDLTLTFTKILQFILSYIPMLKHFRPQFNDGDKKNTTAYLVKFFFSPLMTVFFCDQFPHLVNNMGYLANGLMAALNDGSYSLERFGNDFSNIATAFIFSVDVALAWCGYIIASRWVDNQTLSAEPTTLGWLVCLLCYPPISQATGWYFSTPSDHAYMQIGNMWVVGLFGTMMIMSYLVYMSATLYFGVRFSNLTNRGIIRKGPFSIVRHPAYASKNFAWWCVMFPGVIYGIQNNGWHQSIALIIGLILMTFIYYKRAITEERHLMADPFYQEYCKQVRYRFIPGIL